MKKAIKRILIANRGEIAIRIARAATEMGIETVSVYSEDDVQALHVRAADKTQALTGRGAAAYLDIAQIIRAAMDNACDAIHPGYGFLSENADFARACEAASLIFVGPDPEVLVLFGNKARARAFAVSCDVPVPRGVDEPVTLDQARAFMASLGPGAAVMVKAIAGGGGRGMRVVLSPDELESMMFERGAGSIVNVGSIAARTLGRFGPYGTSKGALRSLTQQMALEWGPRGVRANTVSPGLIRTPLPKCTTETKPSCTSASRRFLFAASAAPRTSVVWWRFSPAMRPRMSTARTSWSMVGSSRPR